MRIIKKIITSKKGNVCHVISIEMMGKNATLAFVEKSLWDELPEVLFEF